MKKNPASEQTSSNITTNTVRVDAVNIPVQSSYDVVVCGGGPAGIAAAIAAARGGARTCLIEMQGCLGGVWTSGLLSYILDARNKPGLIVEIRARLNQMEGIGEERDLYDTEAMKLVLDELCVEAGVEVRLYTRLVGAKLSGSKISHVLLEGKEGRFALAAHTFIDTSGDGDLGALAGCRFYYGRTADGVGQPMTLMALLANVPDEVMKADYVSSLGASSINKDVFYKRLLDTGFQPSYSKPSLFVLPNGLCALMGNHIYEKSGLKSQDLTEATILARKEVHELVAAMRRFSPDWSDVRLVSTASHIGVREGRRLHGHYEVKVADILEGKRHEDSVAHVTFPIDVHSLKMSDGGGYSSDNIHAPGKTYDIPVRALIAKDVSNLLMAGRCISGDFHAHASYRVTGNAVSTGEGAGVVAALATTQKIEPSAVEWSSIQKELCQLRQKTPPLCAGE